MLEADGKKCYPMEKVIDCCNWILSSDRELVGGRNFSSVFDPWESEEIEKIKDNPNNLNYEDLIMRYLRKINNQNIML